MTICHVLVSCFTLFFLFKYFYIFINSLFIISNNYNTKRIATSNIPSFVYRRLFVINNYCYKSAPCLFFRSSDFTIKSNKGMNNSLFGIKARLDFASLYIALIVVDNISKD